MALKKKWTEMEENLFFKREEKIFWKGKGNNRIDMNMKSILKSIHLTLKLIYLHARGWKLTLLMKKGLK